MTAQQRNTKIVATLGPALAQPEVLEEAIRTGLVNVLRVNFSHDEFQFHEENIKTVRKFAEKHKRNVAILADLQGPKIRIKRFEEGKIMLENGAEFVLDMQKQDLGNQTTVGVDYPEIINDCKVGDTLLLDDGKIALEITKIADHKIHTIVKDGGKLSNNKGINLKGGGLRAPAITEKDRSVIEFVSKLNVEMIAVSFVRTEDDMKLVRSLCKKASASFNPLLVAKVERADIFDLVDPQGHTEILDGICRASDGVMVARGDLAVEVGAAPMVVLQKLITRRAIENNAFVIMATQMMESMITEPQPTRAEVSDIGNAIMDGVDAMMFSAETAVGKFPLRAMAIADDVCRGTERLMGALKSYKVPERSQHTNQAISYLASISTKEVENVKAIVSFTHDGLTARFLSRYRMNCPIYAITSSDYAARQMSVLGGVTPMLIEGVADFHDFRKRHAAKIAQEWIKNGTFKEGDKLLFSYSLFAHPAEHWTNSLSILRVEDIANNMIG